MKRRVIRTLHKVAFGKAALGALAFAGVLGAAQADAAIIINEVYSGGGSASGTAAYKTDFIELYNTDLSNPVDISGYVVSYGSSAQAMGSFPTAVGAVPAATILGADSYYLIQTGSSGTGGANDVTPDVDFNSGASLSGTSGGLRLQDSALSTLDVVGWGTVNNFEGTPETTPASVAVSMMRIPNGTDTGNNAADFSQAAPTPKAINVIPEPTGLSLAGVAALFMRRRRK